MFVVWLCFCGGVGVFVWWCGSVCAFVSLWWCGCGFYAGMVLFFLCF